MQTTRASLTGLPTELRLMILEHALIDTHIGPSSVQSSTSSWALVQLNRLIRTEAYPLFFELATFHFSSDKLATAQLATFLDVIGPTAVANMRAIEFVCRGWCTMFGLQTDYLPSHSDFLDGWTGDEFAHNTDFCSRELSWKLPPTGSSSPSSSSSSSSSRNNDTRGDRTRDSSSSSSAEEEDEFGGIFANRLWTNHNPAKSRLCSYGAFGCREQSYEAFRHAGLLQSGNGNGNKNNNGNNSNSNSDSNSNSNSNRSKVMSKEKLMKLWSVLNRDNRSSAA